MIRVCSYGHGRLDAMAAGKSMVKDNIFLQALHAVDALTIHPSAIVMPRLQ
jgi:hypothetical protein